MYRWLMAGGRLRKAADNAEAPSTVRPVLMCMSRCDYVINIDDDYALLVG